MKFNPLDESRAREARAIPTRDAVVRGGLLNDRKRSEGDARIREAQAEKYASFHFRRFGVQPTPEQIASYLGEDPNTAA